MVILSLALSISRFLFFIYLILGIVSLIKKDGLAMKRFRVSGYFIIFLYFGNLLEENETSLKNSVHQQIEKFTEPRKAAKVSINEIKIDDYEGVPFIVVSLYVNIENLMTDEWHANPASFTLATSEGLTGDRVHYYAYPDWKEMNFVDLYKGQRAEGAIYFEVLKADAYTLTYSINNEIIQFSIPNNESDFTSAEQVLEVY